MTGLDEALQRIAADLDDHRVGWALVGGLAVSARSVARFTRDVDVAVGVQSDGAAEQLVHGLLTRGYRLVATVEQDAVARLATVRLLPPASSVDEVVVDVLFASSGVEQEVVAEAEPVEIVPGLVVPVARTGHLLAMKLLSRAGDRPQDEVDIQALLEVASPAEIELARGAVELITARGYHRGRDLPAALSALLAR